VYFLLLSFYCNAQIEVAHVSTKGFSAIGFGGFLNFSVPVSEANCLTLEGGLLYFKNKHDEDLALIPVLMGYRYTFDQSGAGLYVEPNAGYTFGFATISTHDKNGLYTGEAQVAGLATGVSLGYLFDIGTTPFNLSFRYEHNFGKAATNLLSFRVAHSFNFGRRED